jgi:hypothetical protein
MEQDRALQSISDDELLHRLAQLMQDSRRIESDLLAHIGEVDARRLYAREASPSMFEYCTRVLHLSEAEAYLRITAARAARKHPTLLTLLAEGRLHLSGIALLAPHINDENPDALFARASHRTKREIKELLAELSPRPDVPAHMRKLPESRPAMMPPATANKAAASDARRFPDGPAAQAPRPGPDRAGASWTSTPTSSATIEPLAPARYRVQFTATAQLHDKIERLQALMRTKVPDGDLATIIEQAITEKLERLETQRFASTKTPRLTLAETDTSLRSRHVPAAVRRAVRERDGDRCSFVDKEGTQCTARDRLEYHHRLPFAYRGDHSPENIRLICRTHNQFLADRDYGSAAMARHRRSTTRHLGAKLQ